MPSGLSRAGLLASGLFFSSSLRVVRSPIEETRSMDVICAQCMDGRRWSAGLVQASALDGPRSLAIAFAAPELSHRAEWLDELRRRLPNTPLVGCSTAGEISGARISDGSVSLAVMRFSHSRVQQVVVGIDGPGESERAGRRLGQSLVASDLRAILVLSDGLRVNGSELARGINDSIPHGVVVTGGLAADADRFGHTWVLTPEGPASGCVVAVGLYGERLQIGHGSKGGWDIFGPERRVTRASGRVLYELDGKPALRLYKEYLGDRSAGLPATALLFPLSLRGEARGGESVVRTVLAVDEEASSMTFAGDVPEGSMARLMRANFDRLVEGAATAALSSAARCAGSVLAIAISCVGRRLVLGERSEEEVEATLEVLPPGAAQVGFYSYGELSPLATGRCDLHNQTMTITTIGED